VPEARGEHVVVGRREPQRGPFANEHRAGLGPRLVPGVGEERRQRGLGERRRRRCRRGGADPGRRLKFRAVLPGPLERCAVGIEGEVVDVDGLRQAGGERPRVRDDVVAAQLEGPEPAGGHVQPEDATR